MLLPIEIESGNIEYKLKIIPDNNNRLIRLATQLNWRCNEGRGMAIYFLGVNDMGEIIGITSKEFNESMNNLTKMVALNKATILQKNINQLICGKLWATIIIISNINQMNVNNKREITYTFGCKSL